MSSSTSSSSDSEDFLDETLHFSEDSERLQIKQELYEYKFFHVRKGVHPHLADRKERYHKLSNKLKRQQQAKQKTKNRRLERDITRGVRRGGTPYIRFPPRNRPSKKELEWRKRKEKKEEENNIRLMRARDRREMQRQAALERLKERQERRKEREMKEKEEAKARERRRVMPIISRKKRGLVEHGRIVEQEITWPKKKPEELEKSAKHHFSLLSKLGSHEQKAVYLVELLREQKAAREVQEKKDAEEKKNEGTVEKTDAVSENGGKTEDETILRKEDNEDKDVSKEKNAEREEKQKEKEKEEKEETNESTEEKEQKEKEGKEKEEKEKDEIEKEEKEKEEKEKEEKDKEEKDKEEKDKEEKDKEEKDKEEKEKGEKEKEEKEEDEGFEGDVMEELEPEEEVGPEVLLIRTILGHLQTDDLASVVECMGNYDMSVDKKQLVNEEVLLHSLNRTMNAAKKKLLGSQETKLDVSLAVKVFDSKGYAQDFLRVQPLDTAEKQHPIIPLEVCEFTETLKYGAISVVPSKELFEHAFDVFTNSFFRGVNLAGGIIAGGLVTSCLQPLDKIYIRAFSKYREMRRIVRRIPLPSHIIDRIEFYAGVEEDARSEFSQKLKNHYFNTPYTTSDVDIFIVADNLEEAEKKMKRLYKNVKKRFKQLQLEYVLARTANAVTFCSRYPQRNIQLIITTLRSLDDFLLFCDLDCTSCVYDGREVYMSPRSVRAFNKRCNVLAPSQLNMEMTRSRVLKYAARGFSTILIELNKRTLMTDEQTLSSITQRILTNSEYQKRQIMMFGEYSAQRPFFSSDATRETMEMFFSDSNVPYGQKLKDVWTQKKEERRRKRPLVENFAPKFLFGSAIPPGLGRGRGGRMAMGAYGGDIAGKENEEEETDENPKMLPQMRWKWLDTLRTRDVDYLLPRCYMCKKRTIPSFEPDQVGLTLCVDCKKKNREMMEQWDNINDIDDCVALVTGARIKIGYYIALRLLRSGATVIAVTRFPHDAALRYSKEPDFEKWKHKLHIYGVDLRHLPSVNEFIIHVMQRYKRIDMLINNAAQTKRRPRAYYYEVINRERQLMSGELQEKFLVKDFVSDPFLIEYDISPDSGSPVPKQTSELKTALVPVVMAMSEISLDSSLPKSAALTQVQLHQMDKEERNDELFPPGKVDEHNEPLDLRPSTSWNQQIDKISMVELVEVQIVNSTVPFMFISSFTPLLKEAAAISHRKRAFVVNVTAVEGNFKYNKRNGGHPHTNMAKAALNMLTKSIGDTFAQSSIYTTAVDTGWCTEMRYVPMEKRDANGVPLNPVPLTDKDGAARVLYPIYVGLTSVAPPPHGVLYHDFEVVPWI